MTKLLLIALSILPFFSQPSDTVKSYSQNADGRDWQRLILRDEEFSVLVPTQPRALVGRQGYLFPGASEKVLRCRAYSGYAEGFIFVIESYGASRPQRLLKDVNLLFRNFDQSQLETLSEANFVGFNATKYKIGRSSFTGYKYVFAGREHVYVVTVAAKNMLHPSFSRFLSSFALGRYALTGTVTPKVHDSSVFPASAAGMVVSSKETSPKVILVWKPEPYYTEAARRNQRIGTVVLRGIFTSAGEVIITDIVNPLGDGLTEKAIAAAKNIGFFPAEKDGQLVSVAMQLEYNFNLY